MTYDFLSLQVSAVLSIFCSPIFRIWIFSVCLFGSGCCDTRFKFSFKKGEWLVAHLTRQAI